MATNMAENMFITHNQITKWMFDDKADPRVKDWLFMKDPTYVLGLILVYVFLIYVYLPKYMEERKPYKLKLFIQCYDIFQVIVCSIVAHGTITSAWKGWDTFKCYPVDYSENKAAVQLAGYFWWNMMLKFVELIETIIFALRKKNSQISALHVYHHISTFALAWIAAKYGPGGMLMVTVFLNSSVHVLMYGYYFLASLGPVMQKKLDSVKSKLTLIQLSQLIFLFLHAIQSIAPNCDVVSVYPIFYLPVVAGNILLFMKFYHKTYINKKRQ